MSGQSGLSFGRYRVEETEEWLLRIGHDAAPAILFLPPLFEEMNRMRAFMAAMMRALANRGYRCLLPDLPGTGESERSLSECDLQDWREAVRALAEEFRPVGLVSIRGGCLLDDAAAAALHFRFAPVDGASLKRDLVRAGNLSGGNLSGGGYAGYVPSESLMSALEAASPSNLQKARTVRLASDRAEADLKLEGPALWRRSEPGAAPELAAALAADAADWFESCAG